MDWSEKFHLGSAYHSSSLKYSVSSIEPYLLKSARRETKKVIDQKP